MQKLLQVFNSKLTKILITALLIVIPLYPKFPAIRMPGIYVAIRGEDFLILLSVLLFSIPLIINIKSVLKERMSRSILIFLFIGLVSTLSGIFLTQTTTVNVSLLHFFRRVEYLSLFFVGFYYVQKDGSTSFFDYLIKLLLVINMMIFIYGLGQRYLNFPVIVTQNEEYSKGIALRWVPGSHINSTFAGHYDLASYLVLTIPLFIASFFYYKDKLSKLLLAVSIFAGFWLFSSAVSRISIASFIIATTLSLFILRKRKELLVVAAISILAFGFSPDLRSRYGRLIEVIRNKITAVITVYAQTEKPIFEDRSTSIRLNVEWPRAIRAFQKNPLLGTGYSSISLATDNDYLRSLGETGILGLLSFMLIFINMFLVFKNYKFDGSLKSLFIACFIGSTVGLLITATFIDIFEASKLALIYWLFAGIVVNTIYKYEHSI